MEPTCLQHRSNIDQQLMPKPRSGKVNEKEGIPYWEIPNRSIPQRKTVSGKSESGNSYRNKSVSGDSVLVDSLSSPRFLTPKIGGGSQVVLAPVLAKSYKNVKTYFCHNSTLIRPIRTILCMRFFIIISKVSPLVRASRD